MAEPRRPDPAAAPNPSADQDLRSAQIDVLLVEGLDAYFAGRHEEAVHVWTRVLFLDRSHARARAYIDRARTAIAERQRQSDELLQASQDLLDRGQTRAARDRLAEAVSTTGEDERASALRFRLERLERLIAASRRPEPATATSAPARGLVPAARRIGPVWMRRTAVLALVASALVLLTLAFTNSILPRWVGFDVTENMASHVASAPLPILSSADVAVIRARTLYSRGRLTEALQALDRVPAESASRADADRLRAEIERLLLAAMPVKSTPIPGGEAR
jgi:tetratricopeptide (TPR) repeat protein